MNLTNPHRSITWRSFHFLCFNFFKKKIYVPRLSQAQNKFINDMISNRYSDRDGSPSLKIELILKNLEPVLFVGSSLFFFFLFSEIACFSFSSFSINNCCQQVIIPIDRYNFLEKLSLFFSSNLLSLFVYSLPQTLQTPLNS